LNRNNLVQFKLLNLFFRVIVEVAKVLLAGDWYCDRVDTLSLAAILAVLLGHALLLDSFWGGKNTGPDCV